MTLELIAGRYRLYEPIASGGMGTVHFARLMGDAGFARTVAIKRVHPKYLKSGAIVASLVDEARLASRIQHPNVIPTLDVFVNRGELFVVMEFVLGETLANLNREHIQRGEPVPVPIALSIGIGMLQGLHAAHEARSESGRALEIVHRDVSPQNLLVGVDGMSRVLDFGIAKASDRLSSTNHGEIKGKPRYMAPEQISGGMVTRRTDLLAAGIVLWEALAGRRLYTSDTDVALAYADRRLPDPVSKWNPLVTARIDAVLRRAMSFDPIDRYEDAASFAVALEEAGEVATSRRVGEWVRTTATRALEERAFRIAAIEQGSSGQAEKVSADESTQSQVAVGASRTAEPSPDDTTRVGPSPDAETRVNVVEVDLGADAEPKPAPVRAPPTARPADPDTTRTASTVVASSPQAEPSRPSRGTWVAAILGALVLLVLGGVWVNRGARETALGKEGTTSAEAFVMVIPKPTEEPQAAPRSDALSSPTPSQSVTLSPSAATKTAAPLPAVKSLAPLTSTKPTAPPGGTTPASCIPPFSWVDGVKKYKPECLPYLQ